MSSRLEVFDPLYGNFSLPGFLRSFLNTPEFKRLSAISLINFESFELATLSETKRLSHTLGVVHLGTRLTSLGLDEGDIKALLFAIIVHDIGTPPFAHTLEYEFARQYQLNHEQIGLLILDGKHHRLNLEHQIFRGRPIKIVSIIEKTGLESKIRSILARAHPLSALLFGDIDLDNIDNVYRMAFMLGRRFDIENPGKLASKIDIDKKGKKLLSKNDSYLIEDWLKCRKFSYQAILDTPRHRQNQAVFSRIIFEALHAEIIGRNDWFLTDEQLLVRLLAHRNLRGMFNDLYQDRPIKEFAFGIVPKIAISRNELLDHRDELTKLIEKSLSKYVYVSFFNYEAAISRLVTFVDPVDNKKWTIGSSDGSYRLHVFVSPAATKGRVLEAEKTTKLVINEYAKSLGWQVNSPTFGAGRS